MDKQNRQTVGDMTPKELQRVVRDGVFSGGFGLVLLLSIVGPIVWYLVSAIVDALRAAG